MDSALAVRALGALAHDHRLAAFRLLVQAGPTGLPAGVIAERLGLAPSSLNFHLAALVQAGLVTQQRQSRLVIHRADYAAMGDLMGYLTENCCGGASCGDQVVGADACCPPDLVVDPTPIHEGKVA
ncbi:ArsR/SmtB family transcription factor [Novosphingobium sp.]|uniref:ArsR/SmtB family transcription factor n=1 Tax=Novosphingobium sp. TaxID=1874826 RepID=UPI0038BC442A